MIRSTMLFSVYWATCFWPPLLFAETSKAESLLICPLLRAKQMPENFRVPAMKFTGPAGDGRRGSAGFVVQAREFVSGDGTRWDFVFQRAKSGFHFQVIHPFQNGHVVVSFTQGLAIHRGGSWGKIGWGDPGTSDKVKLTEAGKEVTSLRPDRKYKIASQLSAEGEYQMWIDGALICQHQIDKATPLILEVPKKARIWAGSGWDRTPFAGEGFRPKLQAGHAGLILGPMDGSGPTQNFQQITLTGLKSIKPDIAKHFDPLLQRVDNAREFNKVKESKSTGGRGGGAFENIPDKPSLLVGFDYSTSTFYGGHLTVKSLRPIYQTHDGQSVGKWHGAPHGRVHRIQAKDGYVIAGMITKSGHRIDGMRVIFMRVKNGRLNPDDTYRSEWIGGKGGGAETQLAADGDPVIGIYGRQGADIDTLGFIQVSD